MTVRILHGDCLALLPTLGPFHACVTDPPYHLTAGKKGGSGDASVNLDSPYGRSRITTGFMGKQWDGGDVAFRAETWRTVFDALLPGAHLIAFGGTRTWHRMAVAIEDAGFEIRDTLCWLYGSGFPKSHDVAKAIDRANGVTREDKFEGAFVRRAGPTGNKRCETCGKCLVSGSPCQCPRPQDVAVSPEAAAWQGWGTALKPAFEPIILARKPLIGTVAANVQQHGCGALNISACRVEYASDADREGAITGQGTSDSIYGGGKGLRPSEMGTQRFTPQVAGRWPANVVHDGSGEVLAAFPDAGGQQAAVTGNEPTANGFSGPVAFSGMKARIGGYEPRGDAGSAARFFYSAKADKQDRLGSKHPTVKPVDLMRWLVRLVTPLGGHVLDPFAGSGTAGMACMAEGFDCTLIELEAEYVADIRRRLAHVSGADAPLFSEAANHG